MAVSEYHLDTRIRRRHIPLITQQRRLRHLRSMSARNITATDQSFCKEFGIAFTLHKNIDSPAFYSSEVILDGLNPSWKDFESSNFPENVDTASSYVVVRLWNMTSEKQLLIEWMVFFTGLVYLGEQIPKEGKNFKPNTLIFGMSEGYYGCSDSYQHPIGNASDLVPKENIEAEMSSLRTSYTLSTLSRIKTVERAIKQTQAAVHKRRDSIRNKLQASSTSQELRAEQELLRIRISVLEAELQSWQRHSRSMELEVELCREELLRKKKEIQKKTEEQRKLVEKCFELSKCHSEYREMVLKTEAQLNFRRKELVTELGCIYPIVEFPDHRGYSIHNVHLPNSENFAGHDDMMIAVALGYVCHIVLMISQFLNVPLRYSIHFYGSRSTIIDHISSTLPDKTREFPLHNKNKDRRCFEYGVFLLNKNIAQLRILCRLSTRDLSATLPNLSSLIELRLSANSDTLGTLPKEAKVPSLADKPTQNGISDDFNHSDPIQITQSEIELLQKEMHAMIPSHSNVLLPPFKVIETSTTLSSSLDKGLNDIDKELAPKAPTQLLRQSSHHSSYPNLNTSLQIKNLDYMSFSTPGQVQGYDLNLAVKELTDSNDHLLSTPPLGFSRQVSEFNDLNLATPPHQVKSFSDMNDHLLLTPPVAWTAESSRTNSEDEAEVKRPVVLNDSIFYIPSMEVEENRSNETAAANDDFSADLSLRTEQLANRKSSFQMQRLKCSTGEEENLPNV